MKIEAIDNQIILKEVFNSITIETKEGKQLHICLRDFGYDVKINNGKWHHISSDSDFYEHQSNIVSGGYNQIR